MLYCILHAERRVRCQEQMAVWNGDMTNKKWFHYIIGWRGKGYLKILDLCHVAALSFSSYLVYAAGFGVSYLPHPKPTLPLSLCSSTRKSFYRGCCALCHHPYLPTPITANNVINVLSTLMQAPVSFTTLLNIYWIHIVNICKIGSIARMHVLY